MAAQEGLGGRDWGASLSLRDLLTVVFKRRWLIVAITAAAVAVAVSVCLLLPPSYEVAATLLVSRARAEVPLAPTDSTQAIARGVDEKELNSEVEILRSRKLIEETLESIGVATSRPDDEARWVGAVSPILSLVRSALGREGLSPFDQKVIELQSDLQVNAIRQSNVIRVGLVSQDPEWATRFIQTLTERYIQQRVERNQSQQVVAFFEEQMRGAEARLRQSEEALEAFSGTAGFTISKGPLGTDSLASNDSLSLWDEMRFALQSYNGHLNPLELLEMATIGGATALGLDDGRGALTVGQRADFQLIGGFGEVKSSELLPEKVLLHGDVVDVYVAGQRYRQAVDR